MRPVFYIEADEEIISVVDTLRRAKGQEAVFVFPKNSLVLRSLVNLRLLAREAEKLGRRVTVVTGDEQGQRMAEQAGLEVEAKLDARDERMGLEASVPAVPQPPRQEPTPALAGRPHVSEIGSQSFFAGAPAAKAPTERRVTVRDKSSQFQPALNSALYAETQAALRSARPEPAPIPVSDPTRRTAVDGGMRRPAPSRPEMPSPGEGPRVASPQPGTGIGRFFGDRLMNMPATPAMATRPAPMPPQPAPLMPPPVARPVPPVSGRSRRFLAFLVGGGALLLGALVWLLLPRAEITVQPTADRLSVDERFELGLSSTPAVRVIETEKTIAVKFDATGSGALSDRRAKGRVTIYNEFGKDSQPLVATTRLQSPDGKIFRLESAVVVPGMQDGKPGQIEAAVVADQPGEEYNIAPTTFTIPGFQGSAKYQKFSAKSSSTFTGGGGQAVQVATITQGDVNKAKEEAEKQASGAIRSALDEKLGPGEKLLDGAVKQETLSGVATPSVGAAAAQFEYQLKVKAVALVFSEEPLLEELKKRLESAAQDKGLRLAEGGIAVEYGLADPNFEKKTLNLRPRGSAEAAASVDPEALEADFLGKSEDELQGVLEQHPEVGSVEVGFNHTFFGTRIPSSPSRVEVKVEANP